MLLPEYTGKNKNKGWSSKSRHQDTYTFTQQTVTARERLNKRK